ncbi:MAG TPA: ABC transporter permease subunit [Nocardioides sp.]|nr:ABC transporter permease subunit [Nocardioides sp.]
MPADVLRLDLRLRRRSIAAYSLGLAGYTFLIVALYPTFRHDAGLDQLTSSNPTLSALFGASGSLTSPAGWMNANLYANFLPLFALLMTIGYGAFAVAGQDEDGTLGEIAGLPLTRDRILVQKVLALAGLSLLVPVVCSAVTLAGRAYGIDLPASALVQTTLSSAVMAFDLGLVALAVGAWTGRRATALGVAAGVAATAYVVSSLAPVVAVVHHLRYLSPIYWGVGADQIHDGVGIASASLLLALAIVGVLAARIGFRRLDIH